MEVTVVVEVVGIGVVVGKLVVVVEVVGIGVVVVKLVVDVEVVVVRSDGMIVISSIAMSDP